MDRMQIFNTHFELSGYLDKLRGQGKTIGFVPTMGALHEGHLSLVRRSKQDCDITVVSIFVNPTQFNDPGDLEKYPRTTEADVDMLESVATEVLYLPGVEDVYPNGMHRTQDYNFGYLETVLEGAHRPGHFQGVAQVVQRMLEIVEPVVLYLGQKDYQQYLILCALVEQMGTATQVVRCPIVREPDGLAMSSRNVRLTPAQRQEALVLSQTLQYIKAQQGQQSISELTAHALKVLEAPELVTKVDYFELVDAFTLRPAINWQDHEAILACGSIFMGEVRLIDNVLIEGF